MLLFCQPAWPYFKSKTQSKRDLDAGKKLLTKNVWLWHGYYLIFWVLVCLVVGNWDECHVGYFDKLHWAAVLICSFSDLFFMLCLTEGARRSWTVSCFILLCVHSQGAVWCDTCVGWVFRLQSCLVARPRRPKRGGVKITLLYTCGWMNYWKHPAWRCVQWTSVWLGEVCTSICASVCHHFACVDMYMCVYFTLGSLYVCVVFVCEGAVAGRARPRPAVGLPGQREDVCIDIRVE